jgi:putative oxidoreductase
MQLKPLLAKLDSLASYLQSPLLLVIRLYWGISFTLTGWGKLTHLDKTTDFFASLNIPMPKINAVMAGSTECFGGALLAIGLFARPVSIPLIFCMSVAYATADSEAVHAIFSDPDKFVTATPFLFLLAAVTVLAFGPGKISADHFWRGGKAGATS